MRITVQQIKKYISSDLINVRVLKEIYLNYVKPSKVWQFSDHFYNLWENAKLGILPVNMQIKNAFARNQTTQLLNNGKVYKNRLQRLARN